jgi:hypothetical protein
LMTGGTADRAEELVVEGFGPWGEWMPGGCGPAINRGLRLAVRRPEVRGKPGRACLL